jgi:hypothetical protein
MNNDIVTIGLDFGTHQTKICIKRTPDEGHGEPNYEFFKFKKPNGRMVYTLPSVIHLNSDRTLSYGFVSDKSTVHVPKRQQIDEKEYTLNIPLLAQELYNKYATSENTRGDKKQLVAMLDIYQSKLAIKKEQRMEEIEQNYEKEYAEYKRKLNIFRYFKQATFAERPWEHTDYDCKRLSIWYLTYIIFLLEEQFGQNFSIHMGIPASYVNYDDKKELAVEVIGIAYRLAEEVFANKEEFLQATVEELEQRTENLEYSYDLKKDYNIQIFPEAYAGLIYYTSQKKLGVSGINLTVDIGGGTTDISFFTIEKDLPVIYRYWSINRGLNYLAEMSGFDYAMERNFTKSIKKSVLNDYNDKKKYIVSELYTDLSGKLKNTNISKAALSGAFRNIVYNGGGSMYSTLVETIYPFKESKVIDKSIWQEENMREKESVSELCKVLTTAYGLSMCEDDEHIVLGDFGALLGNVSKKEERERITKECC